MIKLNIDKLLEKKQMTAWHLHNRYFSNISYVQFTKLINGETESVMVKYLDTLCKVFGCKIDDLFIKEKMNE